MARSDAGNELTRRHRRDVLTLRNETVSALARRWSSTRTDTDPGFDAILDDATILARGAHTTTAAAAREYYRAFNLAEEGRPDAPTARIDPLDPDRLRDWFERQSRDAGAKAVAAGFGVADIERRILTDLSGSVAQMVTQGSYSTVVESVEADRAVVGWQRTTSANPCAFCAMLASRGPVYRSEGSAGFSAHLSCACGAEPVTRNIGSTPATERAARFRRIYDEAIADARASGELRRGTNSDLLNAFRRRYSSLGGSNSTYAKHAAYKRARRAAEKAAAPT